MNNQQQTKIKLEALAREQRRAGSKCIFIEDVCKYDGLDVYTKCSGKYIECELYQEYVRRFLE